MSRSILIASSGANPPVVTSSPYTIPAGNRAPFTPRMGRDEVQDAAGRVAGTELVRLTAAEEVNGLLGDLGQPCFHARDGAGLLQAQMAALTGEPRAGYVPGSLVERRNGSVHACHRGRRSVPGIARDVCREPSNRIAEADRGRELHVPGVRAR